MTYDVIIIGCGPVGATLGCLLGARGIRTLILERTAEPYALPRAIHIDHEILRIFQSAGIQDAILPLLAVPAATCQVGADWGLIREVRVTSLAPHIGWASDYFFYQPDLEHALRACLGRFPCVDLVTDADVSEIPSTDWDLGAAISWDIDLFGRLRAAARAANADAEALEAARDGVRVAVVADTVLAYVDLCGATRSLAVARNVAAAQERSVRLVKSQLDAGEVSPLELSQVSTQAASTRAEIPPIEAQRANALYRIAALQGRLPADARRLKLDCVAVPRLKANAPVGEGTTLLLRRPDLREAERKLSAATARVGIARADLYPRLNLGGALGLLSGAFDATLSPLVTWSFPNQAPARARLGQARATERASLASWDVAILKALREVETAIAAYDAEKHRAADLAVASREATAYSRRAAARVRLGDAPGLLQVDAERALATARLQEARADLAVGQAEVTLFRALGGGWRTSAMAR